MTIRTRSQDCETFINSLIEVLEVLTTLYAMKESVALERADHAHPGLRQETLHQHLEFINNSALKANILRWSVAEQKRPHNRRIK